MSQLTPEIAPEIVAACQAGAQEAAAPLSEALGRELSLEPGAAEEFDPQSPPDGLDGEGLAVVATVGEAAAVAVLTEASGLAPAWAQSPDVDGQEKLAALAEQLSGALLPQSLKADSSRAAWVSDIGAALHAGGLADDARAIPLEAKTPGGAQKLWLVWPLAAADEMLRAAPTDSAAGASEDDPRASIRDFSDLPPYSRNLLQITVPLSVVLATKKQSVHEVLELGAGSIIAFDKSCNAPVEVYIGEEHVARGETVKVGEKFGVRVRQMILPPEHFKPLRPRRSAG